MTNYLQNKVKKSLKKVTFFKPCQLLTSKMQESKKRLHLCGKKVSEIVANLRKIKNLPKIGNDFAHFLAAKV